MPLLCKGPRSEPFAQQRTTTALACFYSDTLAWNATAVDRLGRMLVNFEQLAPNFHIHVIDASDAFIKTHPDGLRAFLAALFESLDYMRDHRAVAVAVAGKTLGVTPGLAGKLYDDLLPMYNTTGRFDPKALDRLAQAEIDMGEISAKPDMQALPTEAFLPARP